MASVWKTPRGSDAIPEMVVKIIGSKHFGYLVEKPKIKEDENLKAETQTVLQKSGTDNARQTSKDLPAPTNPTDHQINHDPDDVEESKHPESNQKPEDNQKFLTEALSCRFLDNKIPNQANICYSSVPTGDQSLSYIHGLPRRSLRDWSLEQMARDSSDQPKDIGQRPSGPIKEDTFLIALVRRELKSYPWSPGLLDKLQKELKILDPLSSGFLLQSQLTHLFLRFEVPLKLPTVKILCQRFSGTGSPDMVNYEKLLWFLKVTASDDPQQNKRVEDNNMKETQGGSHLSTAPQDSSSQSDVNESLLEILKMTLRAAKGKLSLENLNLSFRKEDHSFSGCLPPPKVRALCGKHGLYLSLSLLETLLDHQDLGYQDEIKWQNFVNLLSRASSELSPDLPTGVVEKERARRLIHNYNLIYNLSLSPRKIDQALRRFRAGENMLLEPALRYLKEL